jgi:hypothetical protein
MLYLNSHGTRLLLWSRNDFVVAGPGAIKGINILVNGHPKDPVHKSLREPIMRWLWENQVEQLDKRKFKWLVVDGAKRKLWLSDIQNLLCEFSKYRRAMETGKKLRGYDGEG